MFGRKTSEAQLCGFDKKPCIRERCVHYVELQGKDPQGGDTIGKGCAFTANLHIQIAGNRMLLGMQADIESLRNEMVKSTRGMQLAVVGACEGMLATLNGVEQSMKKAVSEVKSGHTIDG